VSFGDLAITDAGRGQSAPSIGECILPATAPVTRTHHYVEKPDPVQLDGYPRRRSSELDARHRGNAVGIIGRRKRVPRVECQSNSDGLRTWSVTPDPIDLASSDGRVFATARGGYQRRQTPCRRPVRRIRRRREVWRNGVSGRTPTATRSFEKCRDRVANVYPRWGRPTRTTTPFASKTRLQATTPPSDREVMRTPRTGASRARLLQGHLRQDDRNRTARFHSVRWGFFHSPLHGAPIVGAVLHRGRLLPRTAQQQLCQTCVNPGHAGTCQPKSTGSSCNSIRA